MINPRKELEEEIVRVKEDLENLPVGSEDYLNACKAENHIGRSTISSALNLQVCLVSKSHQQYEEITSQAISK